MEFHHRCISLIFYIYFSVVKINLGSKMDDGRLIQQRLIGRHVCAQNKIVMTKLNDMQSYCKPSYQSFLRPCPNNHAMQCTGYRVTYQVGYRPAQRFVAKTETSYSCCPGWAQAKPLARDCKRALCLKGCYNKGTCTKPDQCKCAKGWRGATCETAEVSNSEVKDPSAHELDVIRRKILRLEQHMSGMLDLKNRMAVLTNVVHQHVKDGNLKAERQSGDEKLTRISPESIEDRLNSLSEQIAILEERLAECICSAPPIR